MREMVKIDLPWIEQIPKEWSTKRMKEFLSERKETCLADGGYQLLAVSEYYGVAPKKDVIKEGEQETRAESVEGYKICHPGDLAMNIMLAWRRAMGVSDYLGIISPSYAVFQPKKGIQVNMKFFHYLFRTDVYAKYFEGNSTGIMASRWRLYPDVFLSLRCQFPPIDEQSRIVTFLDERCRKIDEAIAKHKALIEKLDEYRKAVITAIMKSCNSDTRKLKFCVKLCTEKANDKDNYIALENIESQTGRYIGNKILPDGEAVVTKQGYVLFGKLRPYLAKCYVTEQDGCCSGEFLVMDCHKVSARFLQYVLLEQTLVDKINMSTYGTKMPRANWGFVSNQLIPVPSPNEQSEIVTYLDEKCAAIDAAKERHQQLMDKLEEYKKSLIYNAVTGKIEC